MKKNILRMVCSAIMVMLSATFALSQITFTAGDTKTENFDGIGTSATAAMPTGWKVSKATTARTVTAYSAAVSATERTGGDALSSSASNGIYNFGDGDAASATDRAIGGLSSGTASKSVNVYAYYQNSSASTINSLTISFDVERYRNGSNTAGFTIEMYYSTDGTNWTSAGSNFKKSFSANADNNGGTVPLETQSVTAQQLTGLNIAQNGDIYLAWNYSVTSGTTTSNAQALGVDNISVTFNAESITEPTTQATAVNFTSVGADQFTVNWSNGDGASRLVLVKAGGAVDADPTDNTSYTANAAFGSGSEIGTGNFVVYASTSNSVTVTGLSASSTYHVAVYEFNGTGATANFLLTTPAVGNQTTSSAVSTASDIVSEGNEAGNIDYAAIQSASISATTDAVRVWSLTIRDGGSANDDEDENGTELNSLTIGKGGSNTVTNWANSIRRAALYDGTTEIAEVDVTGETIVFTGLSGAGVTADDNQNKTIDLYLTFETAVTDNQQFHFQVTAAGENPALSQLAAADGGGAVSSVAGEENKIEVTAATLVFTTNPSSTVKQHTNFSAAVAARDANGNTDLDAALNVTLARAAGTGTLSSTAGLTQSLASGVFSWSDLQLNVAESGVTLSTTNTGGLSNATSTAFTVLPTQALPFVEHFGYTAGQLTDVNGGANVSGGVWVTVSGTTGPIAVTSGNLSYTGYASSSGNQIAIGGGAEDVRVNLVDHSTAGSTVYSSFLINVSAVSSADYFAHFTNSGGTGSGFHGRVYAKVQGSGVTFGLQGNSGLSTVYSATEFALDQTHLIVVAYQFVSGASNDVIKMWINPSLAGAEPAADITQTATLGTEPDGIDAFAFRQGTPPTGTIDELRIATSWSQSPLPVELTTFTAVAKGSGVELAWSTATETDNHGFEVQRSALRSQRSGADTRTLTAESTPWIPFGFVEGNGTSAVAHEYRFNDHVKDAGSYQYRLKQIDRDGAFEYSAPVEVTVAKAVTAFALGQNFPNPFNPTTRISFDLPVSGMVSLKVYDMLGKEITTLVSGVRPAGENVAEFDASRLPSGIYFYTLRTGSFSQTRKMLLMK